MAAYATARSGLALRFEPGERLGADDLNHVADHGRASLAVLGRLLGGPGLLAGGAPTVGHIAGGTLFPPLLALLADEAGEFWAASLPATPVTFAVTNTAAGAARLWLAPLLLEATDPPAALGGAGDFELLCADASQAAPAGALLLGSGTVANSLLTAFTPSAARPAATATNGQICPRQALIGRPTTGAWSTSQVLLDGLGALWQCTTGGTPGTWVQLTPGLATVWSGGGAGDVTYPGNWATGALADGYLAREPAYGPSPWQYSAAAGRWLGCRRWLQAPGATSALSATTVLGNVVLPTASDLWLESLNLCWTAGAGTWGASDKWTLELRAATAGLSGYVLHGPHSVAAAGSDCATVGLSALLATGTYPIARLICTKTGAPGTLLAGAAALTAREARR